MNKSQLPSTFERECLSVPDVEGKDIFECLKKLGMDIDPTTSTVSSENTVILESAFSQLRTDQKISETRQALQAVLQPNFHQKENIMAQKTENEIVYIVGPISLDLNLIFRNIGGSLRLEDVDLMQGATGLKAIAASRYGVRAKFIAMAQDPLMRDIFERWSQPIGESFNLAVGPSRVVPHISIIEEETKGTRYRQSILVPQISMSPSEGDMFLAHVDACLPQTSEAAPLFLCLNGRHTFPSLEPSYYTSLMQLAQKKGYRVVADMRIGMTEQEMLAIYEGSPWMVKPNMEEFLKFYRYLYPEIHIPVCPTNDDLGQMAADISRRFCINTLAVTLGKDGALMVVRRPKLKGTMSRALRAQEVSSVGCGDAFTGTFLAQFIEHGDYNTSLRYAVAAGTETAKTVGTKIATRDDVDRSAASQQRLAMTHDFESLDAKSYICDKLLQDRGYTLNSLNERGGSSMQTFFATRRSDGLGCVIKYSDWDGVSSDGIPWLLGQAVKLKSIQTNIDIPLELKKMYPKVLEIYQGQNVAYYAMEQFKGSQDLARFYLDSQEVGSQEMFDELSRVFKQLLRAYAIRKPEPREGEIEFNLLDRAEKRLGMLANRSDSQVYLRLVRGKPFVLGSLQFKDAGEFFDKLLKAESVTINGIPYLNLPHLLRKIRKNLPEMQGKIGPTHFSDLTHGDLSIRNFLKCGDGDIKIIDVRSPTRIHNVTPVSTSIEYDFAKLFYSPMMELIRNDFCLIDPDAKWDIENPSFKMDFRPHPTVDRFIGLRQLLHTQFVDDEMREILQIQHSEWDIFPLLGEALNYASDAVHRLSQDPSGKHSLMYYLEAVRQLTEIMSNQGFISSSPTTS